MIQTKGLYYYLNRSWYMAYNPSMGPNSRSKTSAVYWPPEAVNWEHSLITNKTYDDFIHFCFFFFFNFSHFFLISLSTSGPKSKI